MTTEAAPPYNPLMHNDRLPVYIRLADQGDSSFVYKSWLDSWWVQNEDHYPPLFYKSHREVIKGLMENAITVIACSATDPTLSSAVFGLRTTASLSIMLIPKSPFGNLGCVRPFWGTSSMKRANQFSVATEALYSKS